MKFTKEQAIQDLVAKWKVKDKDLNLDRTIKENVENILLVVGENYDGELADFVKLVNPLVETAVGLMRHEITSATQPLQDKIKELEGKEPPKPQEPQNPQNPTPEMKALLDRLDKLEKDKAQADAEKAAATKRSELIAKLKEKGVKNQEWIEQMLNKATINADTDVEKEAEDYSAMYNKFFADIPPSITPKTPGGGGGDIDLSALDNSLRQLRGEYGETKNE